MAGVYGEINSRQDFFDVLQRAMAQSKRFLAVDPRNETFDAIDTELDAMMRWTAQGRDPTLDERKSIDISLRAAREFSDTDNKDLYEFAQNLHILNHYFEDWPTDDEAASATDDDFWDSEDDDDDE